MSGKRSSLSGQQWDDLKALIRNWYLVDDESLKNIQSKLKQHGLDATTHQIETKIKKWNFRKNIDKKTWISIDHRITKRKRDGKKSEVIFHGKRVKIETVIRETDRHGDRSTLAQLGLKRNSSPPPLTDCQVAVCTPQPINMEFEWPATLPWLKFSSRELPMILKVCKPFTPESQNASSSDLVSAILPRALRIDMARVGVSKLAAIIGRSMPETYPQENLQRAQNLLGGSTQDFVREYISMVIYTVSNNTLSLNRDDMWEQIINVFEDYGIFRLDVDLRKYESQTIDGFMENLSHTSVFRCLTARNCHSRYTRAEAVIKWLVTSGYCPNATAKTLWSEVQDFDGNTQRHAQQPAIELTKYLLNVGASANILVTNHWDSEEPQTILEIALQLCWSSDAVFSLVEFLFKHGASKNVDRAIHFAIQREEKDLLEMLLQRGCNLTAGLKPLLLDSCFYKETALTIAASMGLEQTQYIIDLLSSRYPSISVITFITPDVLIAAAAEGHNDIIQYLYTISPTIMANEYGITPLHLAARYGHLSTCHLLLLLQVAPNPLAAEKISPFHTACYRGHEDVVELLIMSGADVNAAPRFDSYAEEARFKKMLDMSDYPSGKTPLDFLLNRQPIGIRTNELCCATMLIRAGAKLDGSELRIAAERCNLELLAAGIAAGADPNRLDWGGKTALQRVLQITPHDLRMVSNQPDQLYDFVSQLLSNGAQILGGEVDDAVGLKQWKVVALLSEYGADMTNARRKELEDVIFEQDSARVATLFNVEPSIYSAGALYAAIVMENNSLVQRLILNRPAETGEDPFEITAIAVAAVSGDLALLRILLAHPPSCHAGPLPLEAFNTVCNPEIYNLVEDIRRRRCPSGWLNLRKTRDQWLHGSPLALLASSRRPDALEACSLLLGSGFRADELTWVAAADFNNTVFIEALLNHNQRGDYKYEKFGGQGPLARAIRHCNGKLIELLLTAGVDASCHGQRAGKLLAAAVSGGLDIVHKLVQAGADVNPNAYVGWHDRSPLQAAVAYGETDIVHCLVQAGAEVDGPPAEQAGATALQFAAINGDLGLAKYLIDKGAQVNAPPARKHGRTALQGAAENGRLDMLEFLLIEGALTTGRWRRRFIKAVKLAIRERHFVAADILRQHAGWSEEDEELLSDVDVNFDTDSEGDEPEEDEELLFDVGADSDTDSEGDELEEDEALLFDVDANSNYAMYLPK